MQFVLLFIALAALTYLVWRMRSVRPHKPAGRVIGPDDDPDFLRRL